MTSPAAVLGLAMVKDIVDHSNSPESKILDTRAKKAPTFSSDFAKFHVPMRAQHETVFFSGQ